MCNGGGIHFEGGACYYGCYYGGYTTDSVQVRATDRDVGVNAQLSYRLSPQTAHTDVFSIDADTGQIYIRSALDYERNARYHLTVMACDAAARNQLQDDGQRTNQGNVTDTNKVSAVNITARKFSFEFRQVLEY